jgi:toxin ParE1/3/4
MAARRGAPVWSSAAFDDLEASWTHYAGVGGRLTADKTVHDVAAACATLRERPFAGRARDDVSPGLRALAAGPLVVFYRLARDEGIEILRVLDRRQDVDAMFAAEAERK